MNKVDKRSFSSPENGKKGGVKTNEGKLISSQNSFKHGILANFSTSFDDTTFDDAYKMFADEFGDSSPSREVLIAQLAMLHIRLRRCARFEAEFIRYKLNPPKYEEKLIRKGMEFDIGFMTDEYETLLVSPGEPMTLDPMNLVSLENIYIKYEAQFFNRFCRIVAFLNQNIK